MAYYPQLSEPEIREIIRQHVGCVPQAATAKLLGRSVRTVRRCLARHRDAVLALHREADRWAVLYPLAFGLAQAPGTGDAKLGHRIQQLQAAAASPGNANPVTAPRGNRCAPSSVAAAVEAGVFDPARRVGRPRCTPPGPMPAGVPTAAETHRDAPPLGGEADPDATV